MSEEHFIIYDLATGTELMRGSGPEGIAALQVPAEGRAVIPLPLEAIRAPLSEAVTPVREALWAKVKLERNKAIDVGAATPAGSVDSDEISRGNLTGATLAAMLSMQMSQPFTIEWTMQDNSVVELDAEGMIGLAMAVFQHVNTVHGNARALRTAIGNATTVEALLQIDVTSGW